MKTDHVRLPPEDFIKPYDLVKAIVKALHPEKTEGLTGLECIEGKLVDIVTVFPAKNHDLDFGDEDNSVRRNPFVPLVQRTELPPQLELPIQKVEFTQDFLRKVVEDENSLKFRLTFPLTDEDRKELEPLLNSLPPLTYPMTEYAISRFLNAYIALPKRPSWIPTIISSYRIRRRLEDQCAATDEHKKAVRQAIEEGTLSARSMGRVPTRSLSIDTLISRSSAAEYLKRCGFAVSEELNPAVDANEDNQSRQEAIYTASGSRVLNKKATDGIWTDEELEAVIAKLDSIDPETQKKFTNKRVAELLRLKSSGRITQLRKELEVRRKTHMSPWQTELDGLNKKR